MIHALSPLDPEGEVLAVGGIDPLDGLLQIAFEDGTGGDRVVSAAEIEQLFALPTSQGVDQVVAHDHAAMAA